jgi:hypothetical protein
MGKWTEIAKKLPKVQEEASPWRTRVNEMKDAARKEGLATITHLQEAYRKMRARKEEQEAAEKELNAQLAAVEELMVEDYQTTNRDTPYYYGDGARVEVNDAVAFAVEDSEKLMAWIRQEKLERLLTLAAPTRDSIARQLLEDAKALPDGLKASAYAQVRFVKARKK